MPSTEQVLQHHLKAFGDADIQEFMADYASDAVLFTPNGPLKGHDAIRPAMQGVLAEFGKPGTQFAMKHQTVHDNHAYLVWTAETADNIYDLGTDSFVMHNGKIVAHFFAAKTTPKN